MALIYLPASNNIFRRGQSVTTDTASSLYPKTGLYDMRQDVPFQFSAIGTDQGIVVENNLIANGGFETWSSGIPSGWQVAGTVVSDTGSAGTYSIKCGTGVGHGVYQIVAVRPGERLKLSVTGKLSNVAGGGACIVKNMATDKYLTTGSAWSTAQNCITWTTTSFAEKNITFQVEDAANSLGDWIWLYVQVYNNSASYYSYFDEVVLMPGVNFGSVHAHNIPPRIAVQMRYSDSDTTTTGGTLYDTMYQARKSMYALNASVVYARYWKLKLEGEQWETTEAASVFSAYQKPTYIGEVIFGDASSLTAVQKYNWSIRERYEQIRTTTRSGSPRVTNVTTEAPRVLQMSHFFSTIAEYEEFRDKVWRQGRGGADPAVWVPDDTDDDICILGRIDNSWDVKRLLSAYSEGDLVIAEEGFPSAYGSYNRIA